MGFLGLLLLSWAALQLPSLAAQRTTPSQHRFKVLTTQCVQSVMYCSSVDSLLNYDFPAILKPRVPGTPSHEEVKEYIISRLQQLDGSRWNITTHSFTDGTPFGEKPFTNIIATLDPEVGKRLVLAAHYDSKYLQPVGGRHFLGATDAALPVALLLDVALSLDSKLQARELTDYSLQLIFVDGEEAFQAWMPTDSLYGSRQLAREMEQRDGLLSVGDRSGIEAMEAFILLDLIGSTDPHPTFYDTFHNTSPLFQQLVKIERRLKKAGYLEAHTSSYFREHPAFGNYVEADHKPFLERGVPVVLLIPYPFPRVWHTLNDDDQAIDKTFVSNFRKILIVFLHNYFHLR